MGLNLKGKAKSHGKKEKLLTNEDTAKQTVVNKPAKASGFLKGKPKKKTAKVVEKVPMDDEVVVADGNIAVDEVVATTVQDVPRVPSFEGGLVHPSFRNAVSVHWRKSDETALLMHVLETEMVTSGTEFGAMAVRSSFVQRAGGAALL